MKLEISQIQERISANGGLTLIGKLFNRFHIKNVFKCIRISKRKPVFLQQIFFFLTLAC
jgi:hypothetical protein